MFPPSSVRPSSQYALATNLGPVKTGLGAFHGSSVTVCPSPSFLLLAQPAPIAPDLASNSLVQQLLRDNFTISTWILIGCVIQGLLTLTIRPSLAVLPAFLLLTWGIIDALLMSVGLKQNTWMKDVIVGKFSVAYPAQGEARAIQGQPADNGPGAVMILGTRSNSPMGMFAPGTLF
jgi:hypothetical protein